MPHPTDAQIDAAYQAAAERYAAHGVDAAAALRALADLGISLHCWQGDDVGGFENPGGPLGGGIAATGNYPGKARNAEELRSDLDLAYRLIPGRAHRLNLHAIYAETGGAKVKRTDLLPEHFRSWVDWARAGGHGLDFNPTCFSHPLAASGMTLAHHDATIQQFWIDHCIACRTIGEYFGRELGTPSLVNIWIPDGYKDTPADRMAPRVRLRNALDTIFAAPVDRNHVYDAVEAKLFGLGSESYVVGSHEFYLGYAAQRKDVLLCLDSGHFHPTETIADKISSVLLYVERLLLHVSRGVRWDSDHVVTYSDDLQAIMHELVACDALGRTHIGLDYFDASINRVAAWVIGVRNAQKALLAALVAPRAALLAAEDSSDYTARLALQEEMKSLPLGALWDMFCHQQQVPVGLGWLDDINDYEQRVQAGRA